jgi:hypothetical protein
MIAGIVFSLKVVWIKRKYTSALECYNHAVPNP